MKITLIIPEKESKFKMLSFLEQEITQANNIKSKETRNSVIESLKKIKLHLEVHGTGKAYYAWDEDNDICIDVQPYKGPTKTYHCGRDFVKPSEPSDFK